MLPFYPNVGIILVFSSDTLHKIEMNQNLFIIRHIISDIQDNIAGKLSFFKILTDK